MRRSQAADQVAEPPRMYEPPSPLARHDRTVAWGVFGLALLMRAAYVRLLHDSPLWDDLPVDLGYYRDWALRIAQGAWGPPELYEQSPLYAWILALVFKLFGPGLLAPRLLQIVVGSMTCVLIARIGRRVVSPGAGLAAGLLAALYGPFLFYDGMLMKEVYAVFFMSLMLDQLTASNGSQRGLLATAGLCLGLGALVRDNLMLAAPAVALWLMVDPWVGGMPPGWDPSIRGPRMTSGRTREGLARVGAFAAGVLLVVVPMTARNYHVSGELVPLTTGGGEVFYIGNNPQADGRYSPPPFVRASAAQEHEDFRIEAARRLGVPRASLSRKEASDYWLGQGLDWIRSHPGDAAALAGRKLLIFWNHYELPDNQSYDQHRRLLPILRLPLPTFGLVVPLAAAGLVLAAARWRDLLLLLLVESGYVASVMLFFNFGRFRMPAVPVLLVLAGTALAWLPSALARRRFGMVSAAAGAALVVLAIGSADLEDDPVHLAQGRCQTADLLLRAGRLAEADTESLEGVRALEAFFVSQGGTLGRDGHGVPAVGERGRPDLGASFYAVLSEGYATRARVADAKGDDREGDLWGRLALIADPSRQASQGPAGAGPGAEGPLKEGARHMSAGRFQDAAASFRKALDAMSPDAEPSRRLQVSLRLAEAVHRGGDPRGALAVVERALEAAPKLPDADAAAAHYGEALIFRDLGEPERMRFHIRECLRLDPAHPRAAWMRQMLATDPLTPR
ncbi:MAG: glycosyltransferase family 39 protein [Candidatus Polarisedimenticolia bacterium]